MDMVFDSGFKVTPNTVFIPSSIRDVCSEISRCVDGNEFSVLLSGDWSEGVGFIVAEEYFIPEQDVGFASVDYKEDLAALRKEGFNVILHSHPGRISSFSQSDEVSINTHFPISILFMGESESFAEAVGNIDVRDIRLRIPMDIEVGSRDIEVDVSKINIKMNAVDLCSRFNHDGEYNEDGYIPDYRGGLHPYSKLL